MRIVNTEEIEDRFKIKYFKCGSIPLCKFLEQNNVLPVGDFIAKNGKVVYKYVECESLPKLLKEWGLRKQSERGEK
ncbi:hypothetical protein OUHCRE11_47200 [Enterobacter asburiae]